MNIIKNQISQAGRLMQGFYNSALSVFTGYKSRVIADGGVIGDDTILGPELIINGGFDADTNWIKGIGMIIGGGTANFINSLNNDTIKQSNLSILHSSKYQITYTISNLTTSSVRPILYSSDGFSSVGVLRSANGTYIETFPTFSSTGSFSGTLVIQNYGATGNFSIDNVSIKEVLEVNNTAYIKMCKLNNMYDPIKLGWIGTGGIKTRVSGINNFIAKLYSTFATNDLTQATTASQPYYLGTIAPNENPYIKNPIGGSLYMVHPTISFSAIDSWSVTTVFNNYGDTFSNNNRLYGNNNSTTVSKIFIDYKSTLLSITGESNAIGSIIIPNFIGKNICLTIIYFNGLIIIYINGIYINSYSKSDTYIFNSLYTNTVSLKGSIQAHIIRSQALTSTQVLAESTFLRNLYPDIPNVTIGTQTWATSNCEMICTPQGNLINNVTINSNTERVTNGGFDTTTGWITTGGSIISNGLLNFNGLSNAYFTLTQNLNKYYKVSLTVSNYISGSFHVSTGASGMSSTEINANGTYVIYIQWTGINGALTFFGTSTCSIDNISCQEIGWSGSQELFDGIYAQTTGTVEQKTYVAIKAAAMWCYYNNDTAIGATYGKLYNWFAVKLLQMDIDYYNTANPTTPWGWRVPSQTDFTTLSTYLGGKLVSGGKLRKEGGSYWSVGNIGADNSSGFSAIGSGRKSDIDGSSSSLNAAGEFWSSTIYDGSNSIMEFTNPNSTLANTGAFLNIRGCSLRLIKV